MGPTPVVPAPVDSFCFRVKDQRKGWGVLRPIPVVTDVDFSALVMQAPEFLGMANSGPAVRAAIPLAGAVALVAVDDAGGLTLVGCPPKNDREAYVAVARELLGLHGRLWRMSFEAFRAAADKALGQSLVELMAERAGAGFAEPEFKAGVARNLEQGRFPAVVLLNDADSEAAEAVSYLESLGVSVKLLGVELCESWGVETVQPRPISLAGSARPASAQTRPVAQPAPRVGGIGPASVASFGGAATVPAGETESTVWPQADAPKQAQPIRPAQSEPRPAQPAPEPPEKARDGARPSGEAKPTVWPQALTPKQAPPRPAPPEPEPTSAQPAPESSEKVWDGTKPGVMSGKRPPPKAPEGRR
jgi:hypothetical protein